MQKPIDNAVSGRRAWLASMLAIATTGALGLGANAALAAKPQVPFKALVSGTVQSTGANTFQLDSSGHASNMGQVRQGGIVTITGVDTGTGVITDTLTETFVAANGDTLTILCQQIANPVSPGVYQATDTWQVIGGTGRFAGATGSGGGDTFINLNMGTFVKQMNGTIVY